MTPEQIKKIKDESKTKQIQEIVFAMRTTDTPWTYEQAEKWVERHEKNNMEYMR